MDRTEMGSTTDQARVTRLAKRKSAMLEAADTVFRAKGFAAATVDDIIALSGGSRQTLYALFGGKEGLFREIVIERSQTIYAGMAVEERSDSSPEEALFDLGVRYLELMFSPEAIGHYRLVMAEGIRFPEIAQAYWTAGPAHNLDRLATYFIEQTRRGHLALADPMAAAHHFWGMLQGRIFVQVALGLRPRPSRRRIEAIVRGAITQFLDGCGPRPEAKAEISKALQTKASKRIKGLKHA